MVLFLICACAFAFWYGPELVIDGQTDFAGTIKAISAVVFGPSMFGQTMTLASDFSKAKLAAASIYQIVDRVPFIDHVSSECTRLDCVRGDCLPAYVIFWVKILSDTCRSTWSDNKHIMVTIFHFYCADPHNFISAWSLNRDLFNGLIKSHNEE